MFGSKDDVMFLGSLVGLGFNRILSFFRAADILPQISPRNIPSKHL